MHTSFFTFSVIPYILKVKKRVSYYNRLTLFLTIYKANIYTIHSNHKIYWSIYFFTTAGTPAAIALSAKSFVTTLPAAITQPFPTVTPGNTVTFAPIQQLSPICIQSACSKPLLRSA